MLVKINILKQYINQKIKVWRCHQKLFIDMNKFSIIFKDKNKYIILLKIKIPTYTKVMFKTIGTLFGFRVETTSWSCCWPTFRHNRKEHLQGDC